MAKKRGRARDSGDPLSRDRAKALPSAAADPRWQLRYSSEILTDDIHGIGHAALARARAACEKKLAADPVQYGEPLHAPLHGLYKIKVSHLRIVYHVELAAREVWILLIADRKTIWDDWQSEIVQRLKRESTARKRVSVKSSTI